MRPEVQNARRGTGSIIDELFLSILRHGLGPMTGGCLKSLTHGRNDHAASDLHPSGRGEGEIEVDARLPNSFLSLLIAAASRRSGSFSSLVPKRDEAGVGIGTGGRGLFFPLAPQARPRPNMVRALSKPPFSPRGWGPSAGILTEVQRARSVKVVLILAHCSLVAS